MNCQSITTVNIKITVFVDVMTCSLIYRR